MVRFHNFQRLSGLVWRILLEVGARVQVFLVGVGIVNSEIGSENLVLQVVDFETVALLDSGIEVSRNWKVVNFVDSVEY